MSLSEELEGLRVDRFLFAKGETLVNDVLENIRRGQRHHEGVLEQGKRTHQK